MTHRVGGSQWRLSASVARRVIIGRRRAALRLIVLFMIPAFLITVADFVVGGLVLTPQQQAQKHLGAADGVLYGVPEAFSDPADFLAKAPTPVAAHPFRVPSSRTALVRGLEVPAYLQYADWSDPVLRSQWPVDTGHWPTGADQVALTSATARAYGAHVGGTIRLTGRAAPVAVVGIVENPAAHDDEGVLADPALQATLPEAHGAESEVAVGFLLTGSPTSVDKVVSAANAAGDAGDTRAGLMSGQADSLFRQQVSTVAAPGLLLVAVLSAAAFIVRVRRSSRQLAILMALGVRPGTLVRASRLAAMCTALIGAALGSLFAALVNEVLKAPLGSAAEHEVGVSAFSGQRMLTTLVLVTAVGVVAAWIPARAARHGVAAFDGSPPRFAAGGRTSAMAAVLLGAGVLVGSELQNGAVAIGAFVVALISAVALVPSLLRLLSLLTRGLPVLSRIAARQVARDVRRPATAAAVGLLLVTGAVGCLVYYGSMLELQRAGDTGATHFGVAGVPLRRVGVTPSLVEDLRSTAGAKGRVGMLTELVPAKPTPTTRAEAGYSVAGPTGAGAGTLAEVTTPTDFEGLAGRPPSAREWAAITAGQLLRLNGSGGPGFVVFGEAPAGTGEARTVTGDAGHLSIAFGPTSPPSGPVPPKYSVTAVQSDTVADLGHVGAGFVVGPTFLVGRHLYPNTTYLLVWEEGRIDAGLGDRVRGVAQAHGIAASEVIFRGGALPPLPFDWQLILVSSTVLLWIGVGLAVLAMSEDARPFYQSLYALGFTGRRQRLILGVQASLIAAVAVALGAITGLAVGVASVHAFGGTASLDFAGSRAPLLILGAVLGSGLLVMLRPGQRRIDELAS